MGEEGVEAKIPTAIVKDLKYRLSIGFWIVFALVVFIALFNRFMIERSSEKYYTIGVITEIYITGKDVGKKYEYFIDHVRYESICTSNECIDSEVGQRFVVEYVVDKPEWNLVLFDVHVPESIVAPVGGWKSRPAF
ncbi:MAG: hypothetical protein R8G66_20175 [Cytophagales bacterium]|nr:hypothetical protein [Cytophagales bacterium]